MTTFLPLDASAPFPLSPVYLVSSPDPEGHVKRVIKAILNARRIVVVSGAGISVQAGIPDFRSSKGLFQSLKKDHPGLISGKDLFDASIFNSEDTLSLFCKMIARLSQLSEEAEPTMFHRFLRVLDDHQCLLRVYTQNIDSLEAKSGLTFGVPCANSRETKRLACEKTAPPTSETPPVDLAQPNEPSMTPAPSPPAETPKCIPLHGTLQLMRCMACTHSYPLRNYIQDLVSGIPPPCPQCTALEETRRHLGKRPHSIGKLRPDVVLYNEGHKDEEVLGDVIGNDLQGKRGAGPDLLLVVGTSLRVSGTKRIVREFSKAVRSRRTTKNATIDTPADNAALSTHGLGTPTPSSRRSLVADNEPPVQTIYLNLEFPASAKEWEGVFDVWIRGDVQTFARMVCEELGLDKQAEEVGKEHKRKREEAAEKDG